MGKPRSSPSSGGSATQPTAPAAAATSAAPVAPAAPPAHGEKLAILLWSVSPERPDLAAAPFVYAAVAGAMDCEVEIHFAGPATRLLVPGVAAALHTGSGDKTLYSFMQEAAGHGARFLGCSMAMSEHLAGGEPRIPEYTGAAGAAAFVMRSLDPQWRTLVF